MGGILIGRDASEVDEKARWFQSFIGSLAGLPTASVGQALRQRQWLVGTPDQVSSQLSAWSGVGVERVMLQWFNLDDLDGLSLLARLESG
jgi:alkanesulfonate monooxygenase SsuD/methylene tetrahydromethanopterin reductase-like flavin-dependent oxidoreductase (luciferase family)